jgi:dienelactone hydrolase
MSAQQQKIRRIVWTAAIASVTATGAWYGAGLKTRSELKQACPILLLYLPAPFSPGL